MPEEISYKIHRKLFDVNVKLRTIISSVKVSKTRDCRTETETIKTETFFDFAVAHHYYSHAHSIMHTPTQKSKSTPLTHAALYRNEKAHRFSSHCPVFNSFGHHISWLEQRWDQRSYFLQKFRGSVCKNVDRLLKNYNLAWQRFII